MEHGNLTVADAVAISTILGWCQRGARITWAVECDTDRMITGVARNLGDESGNLVPGADVRDLHVRISSTFEHFISVPQFVRMVNVGYVYEN